MSKLTKEDIVHFMCGGITTQDEISTILSKAFPSDDNTTLIDSIPEDEWVSEELFDWNITVGRPWMTRDQQLKFMSEAPERHEKYSKERLKDPEFRKRISTKP